MSVYFAGDTTIEGELRLRANFERLPLARQQALVREWQELANGRRFWLNLTAPDSHEPSRLMTHADLEALLVKPGGW